MGEKNPQTSLRTSFRSVNVGKSTQTGRYAPVIQAIGPLDFDYASGIGTAATTVTLGIAISAGMTFYARDIDITNTTTTAQTVTLYDNGTAVDSFVVAAGATVHLSYNIGIPFSTKVQASAGTASVVNIALSGILST